MTIINVTADHIAKGEPQSCARCPIALAVSEAFPNAEYIEVGAPDITFYLRGKWVSTELPPAAKEFIVAFDRQAPVEPFTFIVDRPAVTP